MRRIVGILLTLYALSLCFGDAYKLHSWVPIPMAVLLIALVVVGWALLLTPHVWLSRGWFRASDLLLVAFVIMLGISLLLSTRIELKNVDHLLAYTTIVGLFYFFVKFLCAVNGTFVRYESRIRAALACAVLLVSAYAIVEFIDNNVTHLGLTALVTFPEAQASYGPVFIVFIRARGFMNESGLLALFLNMFVPVTFVYLRAKLGAAPALLFLAVAAAAFVVTWQ